jgi:hypothetical protein
MTTEHQTTREEEAFEQLLEEAREMLSEPARTIFGEAQYTAYAGHMVNSFCLGQEEYEEAMEKMRLAATELTDREHKLLAKLWRAALAAATSIDSEDFETLTGHHVYSGDLHWYYRMLSGMIEDILQEKKTAECQKEIARRDPAEDEFLDLPF